MKHLLQLASLMLLAACQSSPTAPPATAEPPAPTSAAAPTPAPPAAPTVPATLEHVDADAFSISGLPTAQLTTQELTRQLGRPDSIAKGVVECGSSLSGIPEGAPNGDFWYYGKTMYEVNNNQAILLGLDVTKGRFKARIGKLVLDKNTTLEDVRRVYPVSAKEADKPVGPGQTGEEMGLPFFDKGVPADESLILRFQKGRLQVVEFFSPC